MKSLFDRTKVYESLDAANTTPDADCADGIAVRVAEDGAGFLVCVVDTDTPAVKPLLLDEFLSAHKEDTFDLCLILTTPLTETAQRDLLHAAKRHNCTARLLLVSAYHKTLDALKRAESALRISPLCDENLVRPWVYAAYLGAPVLCMDAKDILLGADRYGSVVVDSAHNHSVTVYAYNAEDEDTVKALVTIGCDGIFTHNAPLARSLVW